MPRPRQCPERRYAAVLIAAGLVLVTPAKSWSLGRTGFEEPWSSGNNADPSTLAEAVEYHACSRGAGELGFRTNYTPQAQTPREQVASSNSTQYFFTAPYDNPHDHRKSWGDASNWCQTRGAQLVVIQGEDELAEVHELMKAFAVAVGSTDAMWIGSTWCGGEDETCRWLDGSTWTISVPDGLQTDPDRRAAIDSEGVLLALGQYDPRYGICEHRDVPTNLAPEISRPGLRYRRWDDISAPPSSGGIPYGVNQAALSWDVEAFLAERMPSEDYRTASASLEQTVHATEVPANQGSYIMTELVGAFIPALDGQHFFRISADDVGALYFGDNAEQATLIAKCLRTDSIRDYHHFQQSTSTAQHLVAGRRYFIRALAYEANQDNYFIHGHGHSQQQPFDGPEHVQSDYLSISVEEPEGGVLDGSQPIPTWYRMLDTESIAFIPEYECYEVRCGRTGGTCVDPYCAPPDELHEVQCCSNAHIGGYRECSVGGATVYSERDVGDLLCTHDSTMAEATAACGAVGARLCTAEEVEAGCGQGSGCGHDSDMLWTSSGGGTPVSPESLEVITEPSHVYLDMIAPTCRNARLLNPDAPGVPDQIRAGVMVGPPPRSKDCDESLWPENLRVCGECKVLVGTWSCSNPLCRAPGWTQEEPLPVLRTCENYCIEAGKTCTGAWEGGGGYQRGNCTVLSTRSCDHEFEGPAICECSSDSTSALPLPIPIQGRQYLAIGLQSDLQQSLNAVSEDPVCMATGNAVVELDTVDLSGSFGVPGGVLATLWVRKSAEWAASGHQLRVWAQDINDTQRVEFSTLSPDTETAMSAWSIDEWVQLGAVLDGLVEATIKIELAAASWTNDTSLESSQARSVAQTLATVYIDEVDVSSAAGNRGMSCNVEILETTEVWRSHDVDGQDIGSWPARRSSPAIWIAAETIFIFGGLGVGSEGSYGPVDDMWEHSVSTGLWQFVGAGSTGSGGRGVYGSASAPAEYNQLSWTADDMVPWPGPRLASASWTDSVGNFYLFGGQGFDGEDPPREGKLNDLWRYASGPVGGWAWVAGFPVRDKNGRYGEAGVPSGNPCRGADAFVNSYDCVYPGARSAAAAWASKADGSGWLFGGIGFDSINNGVGYLNCLWKYSGNVWSFMQGSPFKDQPGQYGLGAQPGGRASIAAWAKEPNGAWIFGGIGFDANQQNEEPHTAGHLSDMWLWSEDTSAWTSLGGSLERESAVVFPGSEGLTTGSTAIRQTCDADFGPLLSIADCEASIEALDLRDNAIAVVNTDQYPRGCLLDTAFGDEPTVIYNFGTTVREVGDLLVSATAGYHEAETLGCGDTVPIVGLPRAYSFALAETASPSGLQFQVANSTTDLKVSILSQDLYELASVVVLNGTTAMIDFDAIPTNGGLYTLLVALPSQLSGTVGATRNDRTDVCGGRVQNEEGYTVRTWEAIQGTSVEDVFADDDYTASSVDSEVAFVPQQQYTQRLRIMPTSGDEFATEFLTVFKPRMTGQHFFKLACDDNCALWLDEIDDGEPLNRYYGLSGWPGAEFMDGLTQLAWVSQYTGLDDFSKPGTPSAPHPTYGAPTSEARDLVAGRSYILRGILHEVFGSAYMSVAAIEPDGNALQPIPMRQGTHSFLRRLPPANLRCQLETLKGLASGRATVALTCPHATAPQLIQPSRSFRRMTTTSICQCTSSVCGYTQDRRITGWPGAKSDAIVASSVDGAPILFGGTGTVVAPTASGRQTGRMSDLWRYDFANNTWEWIDGSVSLVDSDTAREPTSVIEAESPAARSAGVGWTEASRQFSMFGGTGSEGIPIAEMWRIETLCPAGSASPTGTGPGCEPCSAGTFTATPGATTCFACQQNQFSETVENSTSCLSQCPVGQFGSLSSGACVPCATGLISSYDRRSCVTDTGCLSGQFASGDGCWSCPAGTYSSTGSSTCEVCPAGTTSVRGSSTCSSCAVGTFAQAGASQCTSCAPGKYSIVVGTSEAGCEACLPGQTDDDSIPTTPCSLCADGKFIDADAHFGSCTDCMPGTFFLATVSPRNSTACSPCAAGFTDLDHDPLSPCENCPAGRQSVTGHSGECEFCPDGTEQTSLGCTECLPGTTDHDLDADTLCIGCTAGRFVDLTGSSNWRTCTGIVQIDGSCDGPTVSRDNLVGYWKFEEGPGNATVADSSDRGNAAGEIVGERIDGRGGPSKWPASEVAGGQYSQDFNRNWRDTVVIEDFDVSMLHETGNKFTISFWTKLDKEALDDYDTMTWFTAERPGNWDENSNHANRHNEPRWQHSSVKPKAPVNEDLDVGCGSSSEHCEGCATCSSYWTSPTARQRWNWQSFNGRLSSGTSATMSYEQDTAYRGVVEPPSANAALTEDNGGRATDRCDGFCRRTRTEHGPWLHNARDYWHHGRCDWGSFQWEQPLFPQQNQEPHLYRSSSAWVGECADYADSRFDPDTWHHEVVTFDGTDIVAYHDGKRVARSRPQNQHFITAWIQADVHLAIGDMVPLLQMADWEEHAGANYDNVLFSSALKGSMDEVAIFNVPLHPMDVELLYSSGAGYDLTNMDASMSEDETLARYSYGNSAHRVCYSCPGGAEGASPLATTGFQFTPAGAFEYLGCWTDNQCPRSPDEDVDAIDTCPGTTAYRYQVMDPVSAPLGLQVAGNTPNGAELYRLTPGTTLLARLHECATYCAAQEYELSSGLVVQGYEYMGLQGNDECRCSNEFTRSCGNSRSMGCQPGWVLNGPAPDADCRGAGQSPEHPWILDAEQPYSNLCGKEGRGCVDRNAVYRIRWDPPVEDTMPHCGVRCRSGTYDHDVNTSSPCIPCPSGRYQPLHGQTRCSACPTGRFNSEEGAQDVHQCSACAPGRYSASPGKSFCELCPVGQYKSEDGIVDTTACLMEHVKFVSSTACLEWTDQPDGSNVECTSHGVDVVEQYEASPGFVALSHAVSSADCQQLCASREGCTSITFDSYPFEYTGETCNGIGAICAQNPWDEAPQHVGIMNGEDTGRRLCVLLSSAAERSPDLAMELVPSPTVADADGTAAPEATSVQVARYVSGPAQCHCTACAAGKFMGSYSRPSCLEYQPTIAAPEANLVATANGGTVLDGSDPESASVIDGEVSIQSSWEFSAESAFNHTLSLSLARRSVIHSFELISGAVASNSSNVTYVAGCTLWYSDDQPTSLNSWRPLTGLAWSVGSQDSSMGISGRNITGNSISADDHDSLRVTFNPVVAAAFRVDNFVPSSSRIQDEPVTISEVVVRGPGSTSIDPPAEYVCPATVQTNVLQAVQGPSGTSEVNIVVNFNVLQSESDSVVVLDSFHPATIPLSDLEVTVRCCLNNPCTPPEDWCPAPQNMTLETRDCDGDSVPDPTCRETSGIKALLSSQNCTESVADVACSAEDDVLFEIPASYRTTESDCSSCAAGKADIDLDPTTPCDSCQPGKYQSQDSQTSCPNCDSGTYNPFTGATSINDCVSCDNGKADLDADATTACHGCAPGKFQDALGQTTCKTCRSGTYQPYFNVTDGYECVLCLPGSVDPDSDATTPCELCPRGQFQFAQGQLACQTCEVGTEQLELGAASTFACLYCLAGRADTDHNPGTACTECTSGKFQPEPRLTSCISCPLGTYQPNRGSLELESCAACPMGRADEDLNPATACSLCADGYTVPAPIGTSGALACVQCPGTDATPIYSDISHGFCLQHCPKGQYGYRELSECSESILSCAELNWQPTTQQDQVCGSGRNVQFDYANGATSVSDAVCLDSIECTGTASVIPARCTALVDDSIASAESCTGILQVHSNQTGLAEAANRTTNQAETIDCAAQFATNGTCLPGCNATLASLPVQPCGLPGEGSSSNATTCSDGCAYTPAYMPSCERSVASDTNTICPAGCEQISTGSLEVSWSEAAAVCTGANARLCTIEELLQGVADDTGNQDLECKRESLHFDLDSLLICSNCEAPMYRIYAMDASSATGKVVSAADGNELLKNGVSIGEFNKGERWTGPVDDFDEFSAIGPIYGSVRSPDHGEHAMASDRLKGQQFSFGNSRRGNLGIWVRSLEVDSSCTVTASAGNAGDTRLIPGGTGTIFTFGAATGGNQGVTIVCDADVVMSTGHTSELDYMVVAPEATGFYGVISTKLHLSHSGSQELDVTESCSDGTITSITIPGGGTGASLRGGYQGQFDGKACRYSATSPFSAHSIADGDGSDAVNLLSTAQGSTVFGASTDFEFIAFASLEPGSCICSHGAVQVDACSNNVCKGKIGAGSAGATCDCTTPMWAILECSQTQNEQLFYGDLTLPQGSTDDTTTYIMYSQGSLHSRVNFQPRFSDPDHFAIVRWTSAVDLEGWEADSPAGWTSFDARDGDLLVATLVGNSTVTPLFGALDVHHGIQRGFDGGDLQLTPDHQTADGRKGILLVGTELIRACCTDDAIETWSLTTCEGSGVKVATSGRAECRQNLNTSLPVRCCADVVVHECGASVGPLFSCQLCAAGTEQLHEGTDSIESCVDCPPGRADLDSDASTECEACPLGLFSQGYGSAYCGACSEGMYSDPTGTACIAASQCPPGTYVDEQHQSCTSCSPGLYSSSSGMPGCTACPPTTANNLTASTTVNDCILCPDGSGAPYPGSAHCEHCDVGTYGQDGSCYGCEVRMNCLAVGLDQPHAKPGFWLRARDPELPRCRELGCPGQRVCTVNGVDTQCEAGCPDGVCMSLAECNPPEGCGHGGVENCSIGYYKERCSACADRFFRLEGRCEPCPDKVIPFWVYIAGGSAVILSGLLLLEYIWSNTRLRKLGASQMGQLTGPFMVFMTFMQTVGVVLGVPRIKIPDELRELMTKLNVFNFNLELANPECSVKWNFQSKLHLTLATPWIAVLLIQLYAIIAVKYLDKPHESSRVTVLTAHCGLFSLMTVFYLKTVLAAWDCSENADGFTYLDAQPEIRCARDWADPATGELVYEHILLKCSVGMIFYAFALFRILQGIFGIRVCACFCGEKADERNQSLASSDMVDRGGNRQLARMLLGGLLLLDLERGRQQFAFFTSKSRNQWYWWELVVLFRKVALTVVAMFNTVHVERGWWVLSLIQMSAICIHLIVQPYRDKVTNMYEFYCLLSGFVVYQSAMAFTFEALDPTRVMNAVLTQLNVGIIVLSCIFYILSEMIQIRKVYGGLVYELNEAHNALAEYIIISSAKTHELHAMRDQVELDFSMHTLLEEAERLAHGGTVAVERYREKLHLDADIHGEVHSAVENRVSYRSEKSGHIHHTTPEKLAKLLANGEVTHDTLSWQLGMPLHAVPLWQCEDHFDMHSKMAAHIASGNSRLAQAGIDPQHPSARSASDPDVPELQTHDKLALVRLERAKLTQERDEYVKAHDIEKLADTIEALTAIQAYEQLITGEDELLPLNGDGSPLDTESDVDSSATSFEGTLENGQAFANPLSAEHDRAEGVTQVADDSWWPDPVSKRPFVGAAMESLLTLGITGPPPREKHTKRVLKPGKTFTVLSVRVDQTGARLEILTPDRKVGWVSPVDAVSGQPNVQLC